MINRREFIASSASLAATLLSQRADALTVKKKVMVGAHLWVYASKYPPNWDCTPIISQVFGDLKYAGIDSLEVMHTNLFHDNAVDQLGSLIQKHNLPVIGSSYSAHFWDKSNSNKIIEETNSLFEKLEALKASTFGISVGDAKHAKTEEELDVQAEILKRVRADGEKHKITCNLHNHTYEVTNNLHDLNGTLARIPDFPLGPDLNWLIRGGVDPVDFIKKYKKQIVYLHIRDQYKNGTWSEAVGEGDTDFKKISDVLDAVKFSGIATIELAFPPNFTPTREIKESWKISREHVRKTFGW